MGKIAIDTTIEIDADIERVWEILADEFAEVADWASTVDHSTGHESAPARPDGGDGGRHCTVPGFGVTDEEVIRFDPARRQIAYSVEAEKIPGFVTDMTNLWTLASSGPDRTTATTQISADAGGVMGAVMGPIMKRKFEKVIRQSVQDLKVYAETGSVSQAKADANAKLAQR